MYFTQIFCPEGQIPKNTITLEEFDNPYPVSQRLKIQVSSLQLSQTSTYNTIYVSSNKQSLNTIMKSNKLFWELNQDPLDH